MRHRLTRLMLATGAVMGFALMAPAQTFAHSLIGRYQAPLPLAIYLVGAGLAVALSFAFVLLRDVGPAVAQPARIATIPGWLRTLFRAVGLLAWLWIVAQTIIGGSSQGEVSSLFLWVYGWVGVAIVSAFVAPIWYWLDPFTTLYDLAAAVLRRFGIRGSTRTPYPEWLGQWPAVVGFALVVWLELVYRGLPLGMVLIAYTLITVACMGLYGRDIWRAQGETFSVWFGLLGRMAPRAPGGELGGRRLRIRPFASGLLEGGWTPALLVLTALGIGSIIYDGLSQTQPFVALFGTPGIGPSTLLLAGFLALIALAALAVARIVGFTALGAGLVPIAVGYLFAHYFTYLLLDGQRIVVAVSDPFQQGWDLFGSAFYVPDLSWFPPSLIWTVQLGMVIGGHVIGAWAGHTAAARSGESRNRTRQRQVPLAVLMVCLTVLTLWSLGQSIFEAPGA